ncbi:MAG: hypothetical protein ACFCUR_18245 [Rhodomicrobiaceae bacterium]
MTNDRQPKSAQRFSRFSRSNYDDLSSQQATAAAEEPSLADLTARALNGQRQPAGRHHAMNGRGAPRRESGLDQPPPPEPSTFWDETERLTPPEPPRQPTMDRPKQAATVVRPAPRRAEAPSGAELPHGAPPRARPEPLAPLEAEAPVGEPARPIRKVAEKPAAKRRKPKAENADRGPGALSRAATTMRERTGPALTKSAFWLAQNLRRREIRKRYSKLLVLGHTRIADRKLEDLFFVPTRKSEMIDPAPDRAIHYDGPVPAAAFKWIMTMMPEDLRQFAFVDVRAGRGRTALLASRWNFNRILAYEYDPQVFDDLEMNVAQYPRSRMTCRNIDCCRGDIVGISLPNQPCVIYFSGAWREPMMAGVMDYVRDTYRQSPRRIYVILENVAEDTALAKDNIFDPMDPPLADRLKLRLLSPMDFKVYRSSV